MLCTGCFSAKGTRPVPGVCDQDNFCVSLALGEGQAVVPGCLGRLFPGIFITNLFVAREHTEDTVRLNRLLVVNMLVLESRSSENLSPQRCFLQCFWLLDL